MQKRPPGRREDIMSSGRLFSMTDIPSICSHLRLVKTLLFRLTGYGLYDKKWNLSELPYLKSIDTYYIEYSDVDIVTLEVEELQSLGNDVYEVKTDSWWTYYGENNGVIKVRRIEPGGYQFISVQ